MEERLGEILNWLKLHSLVDYVTPELRKFLLEKLKKMIDKEWDGSSESVESLKIAIGKKQYKSASGSVRNKIDKGDIENWDLTAVSHVLRSLNSEWVSGEEKERMEDAVQIRNHLAHHPSKVVPQEEFFEKWQTLTGLLSFLKVPTERIDEIEEKIKFRTSDPSSLFSPSVSNAEASKLIEEGSAAFRIADYAQAIEKFGNALKVDSLKEAEHGVLFCYRSAAFIQMAKEERYHERKDFAECAMDDAEKAAHLHPVWIEVHVHLGDAYKLLDQYEKAIKAYDEALSLDPCLEIVRTRRDDCRQELGQSRKRKRMDVQKYLENMDTLDTHPLSIDWMIEQITQHQKEKITKELQEEFLGYLKKSGNALADVVEDTWHRFAIDVVVDFEPEANYFSRAANEGNALEIYVLARLTKKGLGVKKDYRRAFQLFKQAAEMPPILPNGLVNESVLAAMHCTAMMYDEGVGVEIRHSAAFWWYKRAAGLGFGPSAYNLAVMFAVGRGVPDKRPVKAVQYWKLAAQRKNARAMLALAAHYLNTLDVGQARKWFEFAVEVKEIQATVTQKEFDAVCKAREEKTIWDIANVEEWEKEINLPSSNLSEENRMDRFLYFNNRWRNIAVSQPVYHNFYKYDTSKYNVIEEYASQGRVYAQQVLKAIGHYKLALSGLYSYEESPNATIGDSIITQTALCFQTASYVFGFAAEGHQTLLTEIVKKKISEDQICKMDCYARICYAKLQNSSSEENVKFIEKCILRYPLVSFFYEVLVSTHINLGLYHEGIKQAQKGLDLFPGNLGFISDKAHSTKNAFCSGNHKEHADMKNVIDCYEVFLKHAPADHRFVPEVYYSMAEITLHVSLKKNIRPIDEAVRTYYEKGLESEKQLLPCFLPYEELFQTKNLISAYFKMTAKDVEEKMSFSLKSVYGPMSKFYRLTDPVRVQTILYHRGFRFAIRALDPAKVTAVPQRYVQRAPSCASNVLTSITISEMNPMVDKVYAGHVIDVTIIDDPAAPLAFYVACVVEDTRGDVLPGLFYNVKGDRRIKFGAKVSIRQPYLNIDTSDQRPKIRVDDPNSLIFHEEDPSLRHCRYCGEKNATMLKCKRCKAADYCSKACQTNDWTILQHGLICQKKISTPRPSIVMTM